MEMAKTRAVTKTSVLPKPDPLLLEGFQVKFLDVFLNRFLKEFLEKNPQESLWNLLKKFMKKFPGESLAELRYVWIAGEIFGESSDEIVGGFFGVILGEICG